MLAAWLLVTCGIATLLLAANRKEEAHNCKSIAVTIKGVSEKFYIDKGDILRQVKAAAKGNIINKPVGEIDLAMLEKTLEKGLWIRDAELYFDSRDALHIFISEREPIARVYTTAGNTFYIDSAGQRMPLLADVSVRVPVVTNFIPAKKLNAADSVLLKEVTTVARYITSHPFWNAQIAQIDITPEKTFELVPVVGNHIVRIGNAENLDEKFNRLYIFYKQVMAKAGFDKYEVVDVQFKDQVVASNDKINPIDSLQLQKNIKELIERTRMQLVADSLATERAALAAAIEDSIAAIPKPIPTTTAAPTVVSNPVKTATSKPVKKPIVTNVKKVKAKPKAVMPKRH